MEQSVSKRGGLSAMLARAHGREGRVRKLECACKSLDSFTQREYLGRRRSHFWQSVVRKTAARRQLKGQRLAKSDCPKESATTAQDSSRQRAKWRGGEKVTVSSTCEFEMARQVLL